MLNTETVSYECKYCKFEKKVNNAVCSNNLFYGQLCSECGLKEAC